MGSRRARAEKSVLSRQDIAGRRRVISEQKLQTEGVGRRAIAGVFVLALSLMSFLAVLTFDAQDRIGPGFHNAIGPVGHAIADGLRGFIGICAYVLPASGIYASLVLFVGRKRRRWP